MHAPLCGRFGSHSVNVAHYASLIRVKSPTNCDAHLTESNFQTRSSISKDKIKWRQRDSNPRSLRCERSAFPAKLCPLNLSFSANLCGKENGDNRARTCDPMRVMHVLSQLSYASVLYCSTYRKKSNTFFEKNRKNCNSSARRQIP